MLNPMLKAAPKAPRCCSDCGKVAAIFLRPRPLEDGLAAAVARGYGLEIVLRRRIEDMRASGLLLECDTWQPN